MKCLRCKSGRVVRFVDGFGKERVFCRDCWLSIPENILIKLNSQRSLSEFKVSSYFEVIGVR